MNRTWMHYHRHLNTHGKNRALSSACDVAEYHHCLINSLCKRAQCMSHFIAARLKKMW